MMLRNLDAPRLCNGTRLRIMKLGAKVIEAQIISGSYTNQTVLLFKCKLQCKDNNKHIPVPFTRTQFPICSAFAMTINKSQGQAIYEIYWCGLAAEGLFFAWVIVYGAIASDDEVESLHYYS